ncbi:ribbon-helix-helix domain-containing protein [Pseudosulfitobacter pseudonitzschiae]|uniref:ribbon-helix-helix domain-containing protein n=1 Tax=Pseudosulfitobacter pseudonitzschiae TaxID=1402135 RepID=UPI001AFB0E0D|nr:ribbon-helix-helix domain-containing protein [Pseudosulfitobacter pseudonitzschiae]MBM1817165.1 hypothetical protein [Pseudosulfitobacter pseudonitzschiae]MBM1834168.1 hypothetical protein [Pseudosulfitobacter pseudonitzschiae]MBM1839033.1 hypothetical protein [Pseudosulfitobacter pseudonitzschiae]MBM1843883.1 hypothetical protein [Pseudosulfitobacter pseudonitzschiae]MBM1848728.1 hypothetical protein [Pseudosulfitobacter pseudonitzschiae]
MADEKKTKVVTVLLSPSELDALDTWRYENRISSRGEAIRTLIRMGFNSSLFGKSKTASEPKK